VELAPHREHQYLDTMANNSTGIDNARRDMDDLSLIHRFLAVPEHPLPAAIAGIILVYSGRSISSKFEREY
jgi:hypothetical protein